MDPEAVRRGLHFLRRMVKAYVWTAPLSAQYGRLQTPSRWLPANRRIDAEWIPSFERRSKQLKKLLPDVPASFTQQLHKQMTSLAHPRSSASPASELTERVSSELVKAIQMYAEERLKVRLQLHFSHSCGTQCFSLLQLSSAGLLTTRGRQKGHGSSSLCACPQAGDPRGQVGAHPGDLHRHATDLASRHESFWRSCPEH